MTCSRYRHFTLLDALILVAATALGCALAKWSGIVPFRFIFIGPELPVPKRYVFVVLSTVNYPGTPLLVSWTLGIFLTRMRRPRPTRTKLFRQPGIVATSAATLAIVVESLWLVGMSFRQGRNMLYSAFGGWRYFCAFAVAGAWLTLALSGRWHNEPGWIDRAGRLVGATWIGLAVFNLTYDILLR